ncbi:MAG: hypothetical protein SFX73_09875 [Kofleriaceae bacterium]|nr:hypothetical protein [Kofleriaceae bacterium]
MTLILLAAAPAHAGTSWSASLGGGRINGVGPGEHIDGYVARFGWVWSPSPALSMGPEVSFLQLAGERDGGPATARGTAIIGLVRWHALRAAGGSAYVTLGWGGVVYGEPFPPRGTRLNGTSMFGGGVAARVGDESELRVELRRLHSSNGKGLVPENPAFDGVELGVHLQVKL